MKEATTTETLKKNGGKAGRAVCMAVCLLAAALFILLPVQTAFGDVIWTPDDAFYEEHYRDCDYLGRRFYANGKEGYVTVRERPGRGAVLDFLPNGSVLFVSRVYGKWASGSWGLVQYKKDENGVPLEDYSYEEGAVVGWINLDELVVVYDNQSFTEEHAAEIEKKKQGESPKIFLPENSSIYMWDYPGAANVRGELHMMDNEPEFDSVYEASNGDLWAHTGYYYGYEDFWINLSRPGDEVSGIEPVEEPKLIPAMDREKLERLPKGGRPGMGTSAAVGGLILLVLVLTAVVIRLMAGKRDGGERADGSAKRPGQ